MTHAAQRILIVGGGFSGMSAAIELRKLGAEVDLVELDPGWRSYGAGISLGPATLRLFEQLGILDEFLKHGAATDNVELRAPHGAKIGEIPTPRLARPDVPSGGAVMRPVLARILADATRASGAQVRLGCTFTQLTQDEQGVQVSFSDGQTHRYDLVIGADGLYSKVREAVFPQAPKPRYIGQGVWRAVVPRPPEIATVTMWLGSRFKPGVNPVSADEAYIFITEASAQKVHPEPVSYISHMKSLLDGFDDPVLQRVRGQLGSDSQIIYRPLEGLLMPRPWYSGRVVLIGDAVHATTPHLASGACIGMEDAWVLAQELAAAQTLSAALAAFEERRYERCRMVVENSGRIGEIEIAGGDEREISRLMGQSMMALNQPV